MGLLNAETAELWLLDEIRRMESREVMHFPTIGILRLYMTQDEAGSMVALCDDLNIFLGSMSSAGDFLIRGGTSVKNEVWSGVSGV